MKTKTKTVLRLENLSIGYRSPILSNINTSIKKGEILLLTGKNGCGKTTLLKTIYGEIPLLKGNIIIEEKNVSEISNNEIARYIAVVLSKALNNPNLRVFDLIILGRYPYKTWYQRLSKKEMETIEHVIHILGLHNYKEYNINKLSDGNLQKVMIARALVQDSPLLILDEPTSHLDMENKLELMKIIRHYANEKEKAILFTSHDLALGLTVSDKLWFIKDSVLYAGYTEDIAKNHNIFNYFVTGDMFFNYQTNEYNFLYSDKKKEVQLIGNSQAMYWLKKALVKNQYTISDQAPIRISEKKSIYHLIDKNETIYTFTFIEELINFLRFHSFNK